MQGRGRAIFLDQVLLCGVHVAGIYLKYMCRHAQDLALVP